MSTQLTLKEYITRAKNTNQPVFLDDDNLVLIKASELEKLQELANIRLTAKSVWDDSLNYLGDDDLVDISKIKIRK